MNTVLAAAAVAWATTAVLTPALRRVAVRIGYLDVPNDLSSHGRPTPRTGGYAIVAGIIVGVTVVGAWCTAAVVVILAGTLALALLALVDDWRPMPRLSRLFLQIGVAGFVVWTLGRQAGFLGTGTHAATIVTWVAGTLWLVALINIYNFMDGLNGVVSMSSVVTGAALAVLALRRGDSVAAVLAVSVAAAAGGFLPFNLLRGSIFMGDAGSTALGFVFGSLVLDASGTGSIPLAAALPLAPFLLDAGSTIVRRALRGERFFSTRHRSNYYQQLRQQGWSHGAVASLYAGLTGVSALLAVTFDGLSTTERIVVIAALLAGHAIIFTGVQVGWFATSTFKSGTVDGH